jgi:beta-galactosidase
VAIGPVNLKPGNVAVRITNRNSFVNLNAFQARWSVTDSGGHEIQSGVLEPVDCAPGKDCTVKIPVANIRHAQPGMEFWLRVSFHTPTDSAWSPAGFEVAWQQLKLEVKTPTAPEVKPDNASHLAVMQSAGRVLVTNANFTVGFSRETGTLDQYSFNAAGRGDVLAPDGLAAMNGLQLWRAPTDNDKGFGKWLARDWREAGLTNLSRQVDEFTVHALATGEVRIRTVVTDRATDGGVRSQTLWTVHRDGSIEMDTDFQPFGKLPLLPRVGVVFCLDHFYDQVKWYGRGPWENYPDRKESADMGVWSGSVNDQYVPYVRPQENGNKEDVRWLVLSGDTATGGTIPGRRPPGLRIESMDQPFSFSALHFTAGDLASVRHNAELRPRPEVLLSLDAKQSGLGNSSCGPGVLEKYSVPPKEYRLHLKFSPVTAVEKSVQMN